MVVIKRFVTVEDDGRGMIVNSLVKEVGKPIPDMVAQTILVGKRRGGHYHPTREVDSKIEMFVPLSGECYLIWHDLKEPAKKSGFEVMRPVFENKLVYRVEPDTCHLLIAKTDSFTMLSLNNVPFDPNDKDNDMKDCPHGLKMPDDC